MYDFRTISEVPFETCTQGDECDEDHVCSFHDMWDEGDIPETDDEMYEIIDNA